MVAGCKAVCIRLMNVKEGKKIKTLCPVWLSLMDTLRDHIPGCIVY